jgi:hypothetical protein
MIDKALLWEDSWVKTTMNKHDFHRLFAFDFNVIRIAIKVRILINMCLEE